MGWGYRHMYYLTGLPGWVRFGYSPGWGTLPPGAYYLLYGHWPTPQMQAWWDAYSAGQTGFPFFGYPYAGGPSPEQELQWLKSRAQTLADELKRIEQRIAELEKSSE